MSAALNSSAPALDPSLLRALAGPGFRRADSLLDERATVDESPLERFIHDLPGWWPARRLAGADVARLDRAVLATAAQLRAQPDSAIRDRFVAELSRLKAAGRRAADSPALAAALACVGEASRRCLGLWPHPVQFSGARLLLAGRLAEMRTGEGKTLVAALAATLMAGAGARVHVVSTNDYLAERDAYGGAAPSDGGGHQTADCTSRVLRGGYFGWDGAALRAAARLESWPGDSRRGTGFRVCRVSASNSRARTR